MLSLIGQKNPTLSGEESTLKCSKAEQTNKQTDQLSKKTSKTNHVLKHKSNLKSPAARITPNVRPLKRLQGTASSKKDDTCSIHQIERRLPLILPGKVTGILKHINITGLQNTVCKHSYSLPVFQACLQCLSYNSQFNLKELQ